MATGFLVILITLIVEIYGQNITLENDSNATLSIIKDANGLYMTLTHDGKEKLTATLGYDLNLDFIAQCPNNPNCLTFDDYTSLTVSTTPNGGFQVTWNSRNTTTVLTDCIDLKKGSVQWYGGAERRDQQYPIQNIVMEDFAYYIKEEGWTAVAERYWLNSLGVYVFVDDKLPLFVDQNSLVDGAICYMAKIKSPYWNRARVLLQYTIVAEDNPTLAHKNAVKNFLGQPSGTPSEHMVKRPIWSTWARYKKDINAEKALAFAREIIDRGFPDGQLEIDDNWETCYGTFNFDPEKFPSPNETVTALKELGFTVTLWVTPFINDDCDDICNEANNKGYLVKNSNNSTDVTWWNSQQSHIVDMTNLDAKEWYIGRLQKLRDDYGIDAFKFDAGEGAFCPMFPILNGDPEDNPNLFTTANVEMASSFDPLIETRVGWRTQNNKHFVRMLDKDSVWGVDNGLYTLITTLITFNLNGYTIVLPDMIGGNGYGGAPSAELFVRWVQATTFMPAMQFSYVPWDYNENDTLDFDPTVITQKFVEIHDSYADVIMKAIAKSSSEGTPVNPPIWWVDPKNEDALVADTEFMLGEDIVVAPVVVEGATSRDVVLPVGTWEDGNNGDVYVGPIVINNYSAPIDVLPFFVRQNVKC